MLKDIVDLIKRREFSEASLQLEQKLKDENMEINAYSNYLLGYINTCYENKEKNLSKARRYLRANINSPFPQAHAYVLYAGVEKDVNIAINYLKLGIEKFPNDFHIWKKLLQMSFDKTSVIEEIEKKGFVDYLLLSDVVAILIKEGDWEKTVRYINIIKSNNELDDSDTCYLNCLVAYALLFQAYPDFSGAVKLFEDAISRDVDNNLNYAHYVGIVYALENLGDKKKANDYFDRIPLNNSLMDLCDEPWYIIPVNLEREYKIIFNYLVKCYSRDSVRKNKAKELYALYLYYPMELYGICRYGKAQIRVLQNSIDNQFNGKIAEALYNMYYYENQYIAANRILLTMLKNEVDLDADFVWYEGIVNSVSEEDWKEIFSDTLEVLEKARELDAFFFDSYATTLFRSFVKQLFEKKKYKDIAILTEYLSDDEVVKSGCAFQCAYALKSGNNSRAKNIYEMILKEEPDNSSVLNNLGVIYEENDDVERALSFFEKAHIQAPENRIHINNLDRVKKKIQKKREAAIKNISKKINLKNLEQLGYTEELLKRFKYVEDSEMRSLLERDLKECAIAVAARQEKSAIVMCGSMIEALLLVTIKKAGIEKYSINGVKEKKVIDMVLNELLYVADENKLIHKRNYHLSHYVKDYRNAVHPAKEIRDKQEISIDNALLMWNALKQIVYDVLHE